MGFMNGFGRLLAGKPVFEDSMSAQPTGSTTPLQQKAINPYYDEHGYKRIPEIEVSHVHSYRDGTHMVVSAWITNNSEEEIRIDSCRMLGQKEECERELSAHRSHEFTLYKGSTPMNDSDKKAELVFCLMSNKDQFDLHLYVGYQRESDGGYLVDDLRIDGPTRDI